MLNFFKSNLLVKIFAIIAAILLWVFVVNEGFRVDYLEKEVPVKAYNMQEDLALASDLGKVKIKIRAPEKVWQKISQNNTLEAYVDLRTFDFGEYDVEIKISSQDAQVQILEKEPKKVRVALEPITSAKKEISVVVKGAAGDGYYPGAVNFSPKEAEVRGAATILSKISKVLAEVELKGETSDTKIRTILKAVDAENQEIKNIIISPTEIEVLAPIFKESGVREVGIKPKVVGEPASGFWVESAAVAPATVSISGPAEKISGINSLETKDVSVAGLKESTSRIVDLKLPNDGIKISQSQVKVTIKISSSTVTKNFSASITYKNLDSGLKVESFSPQNISVVLEGAASVINNLSDKNLSIGLDLKEKKAGAYTIKITATMLNLPEKVSAKSIEAEEVKITIGKK